MTLLFFSLVWANGTWAQPANDEVQSVCKIVTHGREYDGRSVVIEAAVVADLHATVLEGGKCLKGIYMVFTSGHSGAKWKALDDAVAAKSSGLDKRVVLVRIRGIYHHALPDGNRNIRQIEVSEVLGVWFQ